jgi:hypothetical protein
MSTAATTKPIKITLKPGQKQAIKAAPNQSYSVVSTADPAKPELVIKRGKNMIVRAADGAELLIEDFYAYSDTSANLATEAQAVSNSGGTLITPAQSGAALPSGQGELIYASGSPESLAAFAQTNPGYSTALTQMTGVAFSGVAKRWRLRPLPDHQRACISA